MSKPNEGPDRIDYQETPDVTEVHAAVQREKPEPSAEVTPMPLWLTGVCGIACTRSAARAWLLCLAITLVAGACVLGIPH